MKLTTEGIDTADLESLSAFARARLIPTWEAAEMEAHEFIHAVAHMALMAGYARAEGEAGEMVMDLSAMTATGRAELAVLATKLRTEAVTEGNCAAAEFFARIENLLASEAESRRELERIYSLN